MLAQFSVSHDSDSIEAFFGRSEPYGMPPVYLGMRDVHRDVLEILLLTKAGNYEAVSP